MPRDIPLLEGIRSLRSVRKFTLDPILEDKLRIILESASKAASGSNTQPWEFVVVRDAKMKARLKEPMLRTWLEKLAGGSGKVHRMGGVSYEGNEIVWETGEIAANIYLFV